MDRSVWTINNKHFTLILDAKTESGKVSDRKFSPGEDIWTNEIPQLKFEDENTQKEYDNFISDLLMLLSEPNVDQVFIDAKIGEESEYDTSATYEPVIIRKIEKYIEYMITILIKLPRTEKFSIGTEIKTSMYEILKNILFATKIEEDKRLQYYNVVDSNIYYQRFV